MLYAISWNPFSWFVWLIDHTFGYIFKLLCFILNHILPSKFTLIITERQDLFWNGIKTTMGISLLSTVIGFLLALVFGAIRAEKINKTDKPIIKVLKWIGNAIIKIYVTIFRGTPMMVQAMIIYFGLYPILHFNALQASIIIVSINSGAYLTEVIKDAILSVDKGQTEAARSLGFSNVQALFLIVFPQAIKNCMASIGNEFIINIKDTSVLNVIGCAEMFLVLKQSASEDYFYTEQMLVGAIFYLILTLSTTCILHLIEHKMSIPAKPFTDSN